MAAEQTSRRVYQPVDASPVKSFFVSMLTRDIRLEEAILDLLDNCVDGILRGKKVDAFAANPFKGFWAKIEYDKTNFSITDNCGGIPWNLHDYAFRMGRSSERPMSVPGTVGVYGIGMKRAIFKMGRECLIWTKSGFDAYEIEITPEWIDNETEWHIPVKRAKKSLTEDGTAIVISNLHPGVASRFHDDKASFSSDVHKMIATHYAFIIEKGFEVRVNDEVVRPRPMKLLFNSKAKATDKPSINPFIFKANVDGVKVFLAVGFTRPIPSQDELSGDQESTRYSSQTAGWTVVCNDRAVLYCDQSELTGWGEAGVPRYHTQFIAISGIVEFRSDDASKLPTTTTKRGIDASSQLYLQIKNKMREGIKLFIDYTNKWKGRPEEAKKHIEAAGDAITFSQLRKEVAKLPFVTTKRSIPQGEQFKPTLPLPKKLEPRLRRIGFVRELAEIQEVAEHLFEDPERDPSEVGERCFEIILKEARE
jgi:hypothetical protein